MFNEKYDEIRLTLSNAQSNVLAIIPPMNQANPLAGGPGLSPEQMHAALGTVAAEVHNIAFALGNLVDMLEQDGN